MAELVAVDFAALGAGASAVKDLAARLDAPFGAAVKGSAAAEVVLAGSASGGPLAGFGAGLAPVVGDLVRALQELGRGMEQAGQRFQRVDAVASTAADGLSGPRVGRPW